MGKLRSARDHLKDERVAAEDKLEKQRQGHEEEQSALSDSLDSTRGEAARLATEVQQLRYELRGTVPAHVARREADELRAALAQARESRSDALRQAEATSRRLIEMETEHER